MELNVFFEENCKSCPCHFYVQSDGVVRFNLKYNEKTGEGLDNDCLYVCIEENKVALTDAQCQAVVSLVLACKLKYNIANDKVHCNGITWEELVRRG